VAVLFAEVVDVSGGGFEDRQPQQAGLGDEREVVAVGGLPGGGQQRLELQVGESDGRGYAGTAGGRTCSAGECCRTPSITQVR
jgi:hypothetical protein